MMELNRKKYFIIAKSRGIIDTQKMFTKELINTLTRYDSRRKVKNIRRKLLNIEPEKIAKIQIISQNELNQVEKLERKSIDELKEIARLWKIKNREKLTKEELIIALLKSASSVAEHNFNNDNSNNTDWWWWYLKCYINLIFSRWGNIVTNKDRKKITKELHETEKKENLSDREKEEIYDYLVKLVKTLNKKEKYQYHDRDDLVYYGIKDIENLFGNADDDDYYYKQKLQSYFKNNYKYYESKCDKDKKL